MEDVIIPGWTIWIIATFFAGIMGWAAWVTNKTMQNEREIIINSTNDQIVGKELIKISSAIEKLESNFRNAIDSISHKLDVYTKNENDFLKAETEFLKTLTRGKV